MARDDTIPGAERSASSLERYAMGISVYNEVGPLERVVVHRPGDEIVRMTQFELESLLFDDILAAEVAGREHDVLREILASEGAEVIEVADLLEQALQRAPQEAVLGLCQAVCERAGLPRFAQLLSEQAPEVLASTLTRGARWDELQGAPITLGRLRQQRHRGHPVAIPPIPNLMFTRDPCITVFDRVIPGRMATAARAREPLLVTFALRHGQGDPPNFLFDEDDWHRHPSFRALEGGDVLVLSPHFLMIGCSERTRPETVERLAREVLFPTFPELQRVYAVLMPARRSVMHLDTILTQADRDLFLGHHPMISEGRGVSVGCLARDADPVLLPATVAEVLRDELGAGVQVVPCGGDDPLFQEREQWTDGANAVCLGPGRIVLYSRNVHTIATLVQRHGFREVPVVEDPQARADQLAEVRGTDRVVYTFVGSELSRARGGARCMTMPLSRGGLA